MQKSKEKKIIKIVYFDDVSATDYITIKNGGKIDWAEKDNKEKLAKMMVELDAQAKGGMSIMTFLKASLSGQAHSDYSSATTKLMDSTLTNTILTDYISLANNDENIRQFHNDSVYAPKDSISMYKMYSSYLNIVPKEEIPIDLSALNNALLGERGYYQMLLSSEKKSTCVLRFNINAFKNSYSLADLSKMKLSYYGVKVGDCTLDELSMENEFSFNEREKKTKISAQEILSTSDVSDSEILDVYDIVLAGVMND